MGVRRPWCGARCAGGVDTIVEANGQAWARAHSAGFGTLFHDSEGVVEALAGLSPDLALRRVAIGALDSIADATRARALFEHEPRILVALAVSRPPRTVVLHVLARGFARLARNWTVPNHELGVFVALARRTPTGALLLQVVTFRSAQTAGCWADP